MDGHWTTIEYPRKEKNEQYITIIIQCIVRKLTKFELNQYWLSSSASSYSFQTFYWGVNSQ